MLVCAFSVRNCTRDRGCSVHPVFPAPSIFEGQTTVQTSGVMRRENVTSHSVVIPAQAGIQYSRDANDRKRAEKAKEAVA